VGAGGIIFYSKGKMVSQFVWGFGRSTNNQVKFLALWKGLEIASDHKSTKLNVFRDS